MYQIILKGPPMIKGLLDLNKLTHLTQGHCPTPQNSPTYLTMNALAAAPIKPHRTKIWGILQTREKYPVDGQHVLEGSHPG